MRPAYGLLTHDSKSAIGRLLTVRFPTQKLPSQKGPLLRRGPCQLGFSKLDPFRESKPSARGTETR